MTQQNTDPNDFLMGGGGRSVKFTDHGDQVDGWILHLETRQQTDFDSGELLFWNDGNPRMQLVVTMQANPETTKPEDDEDDLVRRLYVRGQMTNAIRKAVRESGQHGLEVDGRLWVRYVATAEPKRKGMSGAKQYVARYGAPQVRVPDDQGEGGDGDPGPSDPDAAAYPPF